MKAPGDPTPLVRFLSPAGLPAIGNVIRRPGRPAPTPRATVPRDVRPQGDSRGPRWSRVHGPPRPGPRPPGPDLRSPGGRNRPPGPTTRARLLSRPLPVRHARDRGSGPRPRLRPATGESPERTRRPAPRLPLRRARPHQPVKRLEWHRQRCRLPASRLELPGPPRPGRPPNLRQIPTLGRPPNQRRQSRHCGNGSGWPRRMTTRQASRITPYPRRPSHRSPRPQRLPVPELLPLLLRRPARCRVTLRPGHRVSSRVPPNTRTPPSSRRCPRRLTSRPLPQQLPRTVPPPVPSSSAELERPNRAWPAGRARPDCGCPGSTRGR